MNYFKKEIYKLWLNQKITILVFVFLAVVLGFITPFSSGENPPMLLVKELLLGKPYLPEKVSWMEMLEWEGHHYIAYPPMVTFLTIPYILLGGQKLGGAVINSILIFGSAILLFLLVKQLKGIKQWAYLAPIAYVLGTTNLHSARVGSVWLLMHSQGSFFFLLSLWLFIHKRAYFWSAISFAIAFQVRHVILAAIIVFPLYALMHFRPVPTIRQWRNFILGILPPCLMSWAFQWWTLGNPFTSPYSIAWKQWGMPEPSFSLIYFQNNLKLYFLGMPTILDKFPYLQFEGGGQAMWVISPFLLGILFLNFKRRFIWTFLPSVIVMLGAYLCFFHSGATQYGTRYVQDIFPLLIPLSFAGFSYKRLWIRRLLPVAVLVSCLINIYAVFFTSNLG